jgi:hypothetical protein
VSVSFQGPGYLNPCRYTDSVQQLARCRPESLFVEIKL